MATKKETASTELAQVNVFDAYPICNRETASEVIEVIRENLGNAGVQISNLDKVKVPAAADTVFKIDFGEGVQRVESITGMILLAPEQNAYWPLPIEEAPNARPVCYSSDAINGYGDPFDAGVVGNHKCMNCPKKDWQTDFKGRGKACRDLRPLFLLREGEYLPIVVQVPRTSLVRVRNYFTMLSRIGAPYYSAITEIGLDTEKKEGTPEYSILTFKLVGKAPKEVWPMLKEYREVLTRFTETAPVANDYAPEEDPEVQAMAEQMKKDQADNADPNFNMPAGDYDPFAGDNAGTSE